MSKEALIAEYRNLLIVLSRYTIALREGRSAIMEAAKHEAHPNRKAGLLCKANSLSKCAHGLERAIKKNRKAMKFLFDSDDLAVVAKENVEHNDLQI